MSRNYMIVPEGYSPDNIPRGKLVKLHTVGPNENNAEIVVIENGIVPEHLPPLPYRKRLANKLGAELPQVEVAKEVKGETRREVLGERPSPDLKEGMPPLPQFIIVEELDWSRGMAIGSIVEDINDIGWFDRIEDFNIEKNVKECLDYLYDDKLVYYDSEESKWHLSPKSSDEKSIMENTNLGDRGYDIEEGPYPVIRLIRNKLVENASMYRREIIRIVYKEWNWTRTRPGAEYWLDVSCDLGYVREVSGDRYEPHRAV